MITPSFNLTATERVLPKLALDFTTATLDPRVTFTRSGNTATYTNSSGVITAINANLPRFDYNPTTLVCQGLLIEEAKTNLLLNSLIDGTSLATQIVTVTAAARTLSFYGTGTVVLSGAHSATVVGTGAYPTRTTLTFTPTAGALTLTVSGTVQFAQLETGAFATSFIPTTTTALTRNADVVTMTGTNFSSWYNSSQWSIKAIYNVPYDTSSVVFGFTTAVADFNNSIYAVQSQTSITSTTLSGGTIQANLARSTTSGATNTVVYANQSNNFALCANAGNPATDLSGTYATLGQMSIGSSPWANDTQLNGYIKQIHYYPQRLINAEVQAFSK